MQTYKIHITAKQLEDLEEKIPLNAGLLIWGLTLGGAILSGLLVLLQHSPFAEESLPSDVMVTKLACGFFAALPLVTIGTMIAEDVSFSPPSSPNKR